MSFEARLAMEGFADPAAMDQQLEPHPASAKRRRATGARATAAGTPPHGDLHGCEQGAGEGGLKPDEEAAAAPRRAPGGGGGAADGGAGAGGPQGLPPTKHPLTPTVDEGLVNMGELVTEINGELDALEQSVLAFLDQLKEEWRGKVLSVREMIGGYAANSTATLLATSDEGQEAIQRRQLLVKATDSLSMLVGNVGGAAALGRF